MYDVTITDMVQVMARDLDRDINDPKTEHRSLSLLQKALVSTKEYIEQMYLLGASDIRAPKRLQASSLACMVLMAVSIEATVFGYTLENVQQAAIWLAAWQTAIQLDIDS